MSLSIKADDFNELRSNYMALSEIAMILQEVNNQYKNDTGYYSNDTFLLTFERYLKFEPSPNIRDISSPSITKDNKVFYTALINAKNHRLCQKMNYTLFDFVSEDMKATKCEREGQRYYLYFL